jgi:hypothetical protein
VCALVPWHVLLDFGISVHMVISIFARRGRYIVCGCSWPYVLISPLRAELPDIIIPVATGAHDVMGEGLERATSHIDEWLAPSWTRFFVRLAHGAYVVATLWSLGTFSLISSNWQ